MPSKLKSCCSTEFIKHVLLGFNSPTKQPESEGRGPSSGGDSHSVSALLPRSVVENMFTSSHLSSMDKFSGQLVQSATLLQDVPQNSATQPG